MSHRREQVESTLRRAIANVLARKLSDPRLEGLISVTRVEATPNLREARVYVSVIPEKNEKRALAGLRDSVGHMHSAVARQVRMRYVPRLEFRLDDSLKKADAIFDAIDQAAARTAETETHDDPPDPGGASETRPHDKAAEPNDQ